MNDQDVGWQHVAEVVAENAALRAESARVRGENVVLRAQNADLSGENERLRRDNERLLARVEELERAGKRQAAPFSRNTPAPDPKRSGRKPGAGYGVHACRAVPGRVDRVVDVPVPDACPHCGGEVEPERVAHQYQEDFPAPCPTVMVRYDVHVGRCRACRRRVQPRHPEQTSDALGAAGVQLGPRAVALAAWLSKASACPPPRSPVCWGSPA